MVIKMIKSKILIKNFQIYNKLKIVIAILQTVHLFSLSKMINFRAKILIYLLNKTKKLKQTFCKYQIKTLLVNKLQNYKARNYK